MKLRMKILTTIMSMALAIGVMGFAVFAAATQTLTVTNTVNFTSEHVLATIVGNVTGAAQNGEAAYDFDYSGQVTNSSNEETNVFAPWVIGDVLIADQETPVVYVITITNNSLERFFTVEFQQTGGYENWACNDEDGNNIKRDIKYNLSGDVDEEEQPIGDIVYGDGVKVTVPKSTELTDGVGDSYVTFTITLTLVDKGESVANFDNSFDVVLLNNGVTPPPPQD